MADSDSTTKKMCDIKKKILRLRQLVLGFMPLLCLRTVCIRIRVAIGLRKCDVFSTQRKSNKERTFGNITIHIYCHSGYNSLVDRHWLDQRYTRVITQLLPDVCTYISARLTRQELLAYVTDTYRYLHVSKHHEHVSYHA